MTIQDYCVLCNERSAAKGFWNEPRNKGEMIALMHSELSECLEGIRKPGPDNHIPAYSLEAAELADACIRIFDYCGGFRIDLEGAIRAKLEYNKTRPHMHGKKF